ncbi:hypothetical protein GEOBRER4_n3928 [Citrifermentans bremense]|uniref:Uncharacterized protein n=1 Tax=Citrifermentans bremense TaxID=60035 RepID=A0A7R7FSM9_9BACT|nr:hypothetical protein GEOBRER4_n3928 [Citrifermentans bremense]
MDSMLALLQKAAETSTFFGLIHLFLVTLNKGNTPPARPSTGTSVYKHGKRLRLC